MDFIKRNKTDFENKFNLTPLQYDILSKRIKKDTNIEELLDNHIDLTKDLYKLKDVDIGAKLILKHMDRNSKILIVSDYDSDGINSAIVLEYYFKHIEKYENIEVLINSRINGNGFNEILTNDVIDKKPDLIITSDHGSSDNDSFKIIKEKLNADIILTDHHLIPKDNYPDSVDVFINVQREDSEYSKEISGCFVAFLLTIATYIEKYNTLDILKFYEIIPNVAISTISDVMDLSVPINRKIVKLGINIMNSGKYNKWNIFNKMFNIYDFISTKTIGWNIAPVINTGNRLNKEDTVFGIMSKTDMNEFRNTIGVLLELNNLRKNEVKKIMRTIRPYMTDYGLTVIIDSIYSINGIVANNLVKKYNKPTICFSKIEKDNEIYLSGSGRGNDKTNLHNVISLINKNSDIIVKYGGHYGAVGLTIKYKDYDEFNRLFNYYIKTTEEKVKNEIIYDIDIRNTKLEYDIIEDIKRLEPYGKGFKEPIFRTRIKCNKILAYDSFAKLYLQDNNGNLVLGSYFYNGESKKQMKDIFESGEIIDIVFNISTNDYISNTSINLNILGYKKD